MKRQKQSLMVAKLFTLDVRSKFAVAPAITLVLGAWLTLGVNAAEPLSPVGKSIPNSVACFPEGVFRISNSDFTPRELDFRAPSSVPNTAPPDPAPLNTAPINRVPATRTTSYLVYANDSNSLLLQQIKQLEPSAFVRQYQQRNVIQAGIFQQTANAQKLAIALESQGIDVRIANLATGEDTDFTSKFYFVIIPAKQEKLTQIEQQIQQLKMGMPVRVSQRQEPRTHVRVGPFLVKEQAENWKRYLRASGLRRARVYYGN